MADSVKGGNEYLEEDIRGNLIRNRNSVNHFVSRICGHERTRNGMDFKGHLLSIRARGKKMEAAG